MPILVKRINTNRRTDRVSKQERPTTVEAPIASVEKKMESHRKLARLEKDYQAAERLKTREGNTEARTVLEIKLLELRLKNARMFL